MGCSKSSSKREAIQSYLKKQEKHQIDNLTPKQLEKQQQQQQKKIRRNEIIKSRAEINEKGRTKIVKTNKTKSWSLGKINKIDKPFS